MAASAADFTKSQTAIFMPGTALPLRTIAAMTPEYFILDPQSWCATQITPDDVAQLASKGITTIVNNRPDGESHNQPDGAEIAAAASAHGIAYHHIAIEMTGASDQDVERMAHILTHSNGKLLLYCRSGTRSAMLWGMARAKNGANSEQTCAAIEAAGFRSSAARGAIERIAAAAA